MPVRRFRSVDEVPSPEPRPPLDPDNLRIAFAWMKLVIELHPEPLQPGVRKLSSADQRR